MKHISTLVAFLVVATTASAAHAGGQEGAIGVGVELGNNIETGGVSMNYDAGKFHVGGFLGFNDGGGDNDTDYTFGARFYWHLHRTAMSDFGVGGGIGFFSEDQPPPNDRQSRLYFEPGFQIRAFIASNVALSFTGGISFRLVDGNGASITGQLQGIAGIHYYFF